MINCEPCESSCNIERRGPPDSDILFQSCPPSLRLLTVAAELLENQTWEQLYTIFLIILFVCTQFIPGHLKLPFRPRSSPRPPPSVGPFRSSTSTYSSSSSLTPFIVIVCLIFPNLASGSFVVSDSPPDLVHSRGPHIVLKETTEGAGWRVWSCLLSWKDLSSFL